MNPANIADLTLAIVAAVIILKFIFKPKKGESMTETKTWEERMAGRLRNYIAYYDNPKNREKEGMRDPLSLEELNELSVMELLDIMPPNKCIDGEYSEKLGHNPMKAIVTFKVHKVIDGTWSLEYSDGHRDKALKDQYVLFEFRCRDLKTGLIDMFLRVQNFTQEWWNGVRSGRIKLNLDENWDDEKINQ